MLNDLKFALRQLAKAPGFTAIILVTLALSIGACTLVFSVLDQIVLHPPDYPEPERVVTLHETLAGQLTDSGSRVGAADFLDWQRDAKSFEAIGVRAGRRVNYTGGAEPLNVMTLLVTSDMPRIWRDSPAAGRWILPTDYEPGNDRVVVLAHGLWQRAFGGVVDIVGGKIQLDGEPWIIVGVASEKWSRLYPDIQLVRPMAFVDADPVANQFRSERRYRALHAEAKLKPGITVAQAQAEMDVISAQLAQRYPESNQGHGVKVRLRSESQSDVLRGVVLTMFAAVCSVLLIGCANIANLLLARATARQREISVRAALGATRARLVRQLLTESLLLSLFGGLAGVLLAHWGLDVVQAITPTAAGAEGVQRARIDNGILAFSLALSVGTGLVFGLTPAWLASRVNLNAALKQGTRGSTEGRLRARVRGALVVFQVASAVILLAGAGLFVRSFAKLTQVNPGFEASHATTVILGLSTTKYGTREQKAAFMDALLDRVRAVPDVRVAAVTTRVPFGGSHSMADFAIDGRPVVPRTQLPTTMYYSVTPDFFRAAGVPLLHGRTFSDAENQLASPHVAVINETLAKRHFPNQDPKGQRIRILNGPWAEIVGVVADFKEYGLDQETRCQFYFPYAHGPVGSSLIVRHTGDPAAIHSALKQQVYALDRDQPIAEIRTLADRVNVTLWRQRLAMQLLTTFSLVALAIAAIGIYGVIAYSVSQRTTEIGIRMALGANEADVLWQVLRRGMTVVAIGLAIGLVATLGLGQLVQHLLFNTSPQDPFTLGAITLLLTSVAALACWLPARRATKVDPIVALRAE